VALAVQNHARTVVPHGSRIAHIGSIESCAEVALLVRERPTIPNDARLGLGRRRGDDGRCPRCLLECNVRGSDRARGAAARLSVVDADALRVGRRWEFRVGECDVVLAVLCRAARRPDVTTANLLVRRAVRLGPRVIDLVKEVLACTGYAEHTTTTRQ
jgi:hypothetical protein